VAKNIVLKGKFYSFVNKFACCSLSPSSSPSLTPNDQLATMDPKNWIDITTENFQYRLDHFVIPDHYEDSLESVLIPHGVIMDRVEKLAKLIVQEASGPLVVCCVLKGGHQFFADLVNYIKKQVTHEGKSVPLSLEFIKVKSYSNETSGDVRLSLTEEECREFSGKV